MPRRRAVNCLDLAKQVELCGKCPEDVFVSFLFYQLLSERTHFWRGLVTLSFKTLSQSQNVPANAIATLNVNKFKSGFKSDIKPNSTFVN